MMLDDETDRFTNKSDNKTSSKSYLTDSAFNIKENKSESRLDRLENLVFNLLNQNSQKSNNKNEYKQDETTQTSLPCKRCGYCEPNPRSAFESNLSSPENLSEIFNIPPDLKHVSSPVIVPNSNLHDSKSEITNSMLTCAMASLSTDNSNSEKSLISDRISPNFPKAINNNFCKSSSTSKKLPELRIQPEGSHIIDETKSEKNMEFSTDDSEITFQHLQYNSLMLTSKTNLDLDCGKSKFKNQESIYFQDLANKYLKDIKSSKFLYAKHSKIDEKIKRPSSTPVRNAFGTEPNPPSFMVSAVQSESTQKSSLDKRMKILDGFKRKPPLPNICNLSDEFSQDDVKQNSWNCDTQGSSSIFDESLPNQFYENRSKSDRDLNFSTVCKNLPKIL